MKHKTLIPGVCVKYMSETIDGHIYVSLYRRSLPKLSCSATNNDLVSGCTKNTLGTKQANLNNKMN